MRIHRPPVERGERLAGFVYGTIVVLSVLVAGARAYRHEPGHIAVLLLVTCGVFWIAHVYAHAAGESIAREQRLSWQELRRVAHREASIVEAALLPAGALILGVVGIVSTSSAVWLAIAIGLLVLAEQGIVFARAERLGAFGTAGAVAANLALGLVLVVLKVLVVH